MQTKPRVGISACLTGEAVRYSGGHCRDDLVMSGLAPHVELIAMCPEVESGLGAPRESMHLEGSLRSPRLTGTRTGRDETERLEAWSRRRAEAILDLDLDGFILKKGSPTCGVARVRVYRGENEPPSLGGVGIFARVLMTHLPDLVIEEEGRLRDFGLREHFATRVFASRGWRTFAAHDPDLDALRDFHRRNRMLLLAHDGEGLRALDALVEPTASRPLGEPPISRYATIFHRTLSRRPTRARHTRVLETLLAAVTSISSAERADLAEAIADYREGRIPLAIPARLLLHHVRRDDARIAEQTWFAPWPAELQLRTRVVLDSAERRAARYDARRRALEHRAGRRGQQ